MASGRAVRHEPVALGDVDCGPDASGRGAEQEAELVAGSESIVLKGPAPDSHPAGFVRISGVNCGQFRSNWSHRGWSERPRIPVNYRNGQLHDSSMPRSGIEAFALAFFPVAAVPP